MVGNYLFSSGLSSFGVCVDLSLTLTLLVFVSKFHDVVTPDHTVLLPPLKSDVSGFLS